MMLASSKERGNKTTPPIEETYHENVEDGQGGRWIRVHTQLRVAKLFERERP